MSPVQQLDLFELPKENSDSPFIRKCIKCGEKLKTNIFTICDECFLLEKEDLRFLDSFVEQGEKAQKEFIKLNLGCFNRKIHGFINVDIRGDIQPDIIDDIVVLEKFADESADLIYACHCLEHLTFEKASCALKRWRNILKHDGTLRISVPDIRQHCAAYFYFNDLKRLRSGFFREPKTSI